MERARPGCRGLGVALVGGLLLFTSACAAPDASTPTVTIREASEVVAAPSITQAPTTIGVADSDLYSLPVERVNRAFDLLNATGITTVRLMVPWAGVQPTRDVYDWRLIDRMIDAAAAHGLTILATLNATPAWAATPGTPMLSGRPQSPADFGRFAGAAASRYRGKISAYEVWNEPNAAFFYAPGPDPVGFTALLKAAYPAIKAADSSVTVVTGGLAAIVDLDNVAMDAVKFVRGMYAAGAKNYFDALGYHPYQYTTKFSERDHHRDSPANQLDAIQHEMQLNGDGAKKIWATEYGQPASVAGEQGQAAYLADMLSNWRRLPWAGPVYLYTMRDRDSSSRKAEDTLGLFRADGTAKAAFEVVVAALGRNLPYTPPSNTPPPTDTRPR